MNEILRNEWFLWGIGLIAGFQILVIALGELIYRAERREEPAARFLRVVRNAVLPLAVAYAFLIKILESDPETWLARGVATGLWISVIYAALILLNALVFERAREGTWRHRTPTLFRDLIRLLLVAIGAAIVLSVVWDRDLGGLLAALGVGSIVLGLALQETLGNLMAGIALLFERPFSIGDWIEVGEDEGEVVEINWRSVHVRNRYENLLVFPNSVLGGQPFINHSRPTPRQTLRLPFAFGLNDPPVRVREVLVEAARETPHVLDDPAPEARAREVLDDRIRYEAVLHVDEPRRIRAIVDDFTTRVWYRGRREGFRLPYPTAYEIKLDAEPTADDTRPARFRAALETATGFSRLDAEALEAIAAASQHQRFARDEEVVAEGALPDALYLVLAGRAVARATGDPEAETRGSLEVATLDAGAVFGEVALAHGRQSPVSVIATGELEVLRIPREPLQPLLERHALVAQEFAELMELRATAVLRARGTGPRRGPVSVLPRASQTPAGR